MRSLHVVFMVGIPLAVVAFVCALRLREMPLRDTLGAEETPSDAEVPAHATDVIGPAGVVAAIEPAAGVVVAPVADPVGSGGQPAPGA